MVRPTRGNSSGERLGPLGHDHLNLEGHFTFDTNLTSSGRERPLRDPDQLEAPDL